MSIRYNVIPYSFLWLYLFVALMSCEQDSDQVLVTQPVSNLKLINNDSLLTINHLEDSLVSLEDSLTELESNTQFEIEILTDSLNKLEVGLDSGNVNLLPLIDQVNVEIDEKNNLLNEIEATLEPIDAIQTELSETKSIINSGLVFVNSISNTSFPGSITFEDSLRDYQLPLDMNREDIVYEIEIVDRLYRISFTYRLSENLNARGQLRLRVDSLTINSFQNLDTAYLDEEGTVIAFF